MDMDKFYIEFDTKIQPGKLEAVVVAIGLESISDMEKPLNIALVDHPLYPELVRYVRNNPIRNFSR